MPLALFVFHSMISKECWFSRILLMKGNGIITSLSQKQNCMVNDYFFLPNPLFFHLFCCRTKDFLLRILFSKFLWMILALEMICYYLMSAQQAWEHLIANGLEVKCLLLTDMDRLSHTLYQLSSQPYCCDLISLFMSFLIIFPSLWKGKCDRDFFSLSGSADWGMWPTSDMLKCRIESLFLSLQAVDKLFSQEVYLLPWGHLWASGL